jgi:MFS superfamily sulfate permease-like transporter
VTYVWVIHAPDLCHFSWSLQLLQILLGWLKLGSVATYVSHPVMVGFCTAGEILIAVSQLKYLLGIKVSRNTCISGLV